MYIYYNIEKLIKSHSTKRTFTQTKVCRLRKVKIIADPRQIWQRMNYVVRKEGQRVLRKRAVNRITRLMLERAKHALARASERANVLSLALFESNWVNVKQYNTRVIMDFGANLAPWCIPYIQRMYKVGHAGFWDSAWGQKRADVTRQQTAPIDCNASLERSFVNS